MSILAIVKEKKKKNTSKRKESFEKNGEMEGDENVRVKGREN